jgi:hypothetical protein
VKNHVNRTKSAAAELVEDAGCSQKELNRCKLLLLTRDDGLSVCIFLFYSYQTLRLKTRAFGHRESDKKGIVRGDRRSKKHMNNYSA